MEHKARWGVVEWIEHPLLMLEVRGSNPGHSISKNTTSLPETKWLFGARCVESILNWFEINILFCLKI